MKSAVCLRLFALILVAVFFLSFAVSSKTTVLIPRKEAKQEPKEIILIFAGDIMLSRNIGKLMKTKNDYRFPFLKIASSSIGADIAFANLESPISSGGAKSGSIYSFRADPQAIEGLKYAGFDILSFANNHVWDYGKAAFQETLQILDGNNIAYIGAGDNYFEAHKAKVLIAKETPVAFLAYTNLLPKFLISGSSTPAVAGYNEEMLTNDIETAKKLSQIVVVSFHWGDEYSTKHNAEQEKIAKLAIDSGAKIVVGHHPHVIQEIEEYNGGIIIYSLGNFIFDQNFSEDTKSGLLAEITLKEGNIMSVVQKKVAFTSDYQPYFAD